MAAKKEAQALQPKKTGRPLAVVDEKLLVDLAKIHCTHKEMASILGISTDTLRDRFSHLIEKGQDGGKRSLRRLQWEQAEKGNIQMLIWLGKQMLGQRDKQPDEATQVHYNVFCNEVPR